MIEIPDAPVPTPLPRRLTVRGLPLLLCRPDPTPVAPPEHPGQAPLPLGDDAANTEQGIDPDRARAWVAALGRTMQEVLVGRRPAAQLAGTVDSRSLAYLAAWARRGSLRPRGVGAPHVRVVSPTRVECWIRFHGTTHDFVAVLSLQRAADRWTCRDLRVVAPAGGVAA